MEILTDKEIRIAQLKADGYSLNQIAKMMHRSLSRIKGIVQNMNKKVGARNTANLMAILMCRGQIK